MITEIAEIEIKPGMEAQFIAGVASCKPVFLRAAGCHGVQLHHSIEHPQQFVLMVQWETVEHHMEGFRNSPDFALWREAVGACFAGGVTLQHTKTVVS